MKVNIEHKESIYKLDTDNGISLSIPIKFNSSNNPKFYDDTNPKLDYFKSNGKIYKIDNNAGCNVPIISLNIHCQGTHTETASHIYPQGVKISEIKNIDFLPSQIITVSPLESVTERYHVDYSENDKIITKNMIKDVINSSMNFMECLIIRTLPNGDFKFGADYNKVSYGFLSNDAVEHIISIGVKHLIIDTPSVDMYDDGGVLGNHRIFFKDKDGGINKNTITEMAFIPDSVSDGCYFTSIKFLNFDLDSSPSVPTIFEFEKI